MSILKEVPKEMTAQEVFDHVSNHLMKQRKQCSTTKKTQYFKTSCSYKLPNNRACAVGCLIPNGLIKFDANNNQSTSDQLLTNYPKELAYLVPHGSLLRNLQHIHDNTTFTSYGERRERMRTALSRLGREKGLVTRKVLALATRVLVISHRYR